jgi:hypothetical protein
LIYIPPPNEENQKEGSDSKLVPEGEYLLSLKNCEEKWTPKKRKYVSIGFQILSGDHAGKWLNLSLWYEEKNEARLIDFSQKTLSQLLLCCGIEPAHFSDSDQLLHKKVIAKVKYLKDTWKSDRDGVEAFKNEIKSFKTYTQTQEDRDQHEDSSMFAQDEPDTGSDSGSDDIPF